MNLATIDQLADKLGITIEATDARADTELGEASDFIRAYTSQVFEFVEDDVADLHGSWECELWLPQKPVLALTELSVRGPGQGTFLVHDAALFTAERRGLVLRTGGWFGPLATIRVKYDHGFEDIPPEISRLCASLAARGYSRAVGTSEVESESKSMGSFSHAVTYSAAQMSVGLTAHEAKVLDRWRAWGLQH